MDMNETLDAVWCIDSETGHKVLMDRKTNKVIMTEECLKCKEDKDAQLG